jgi:hypothetical protein
MKTCIKYNNSVAHLAYNLIAILETYVGGISLSQSIITEN